MIGFTCCIWVNTIVVTDWYLYSAAIGHGASAGADGFPEIIGLATEYVGLCGGIAELREGGGAIACIGEEIAALLVPKVADLVEGVID